MNRADIRSLLAPVAKTSKVPSPGPAPLAPDQLKLVAGGAPRGGWDQPVQMTATQAPRGGW